MINPNHPDSNHSMVNVRFLSLMSLKPSHAMYFKLDLLTDDYLLLSSVPARCFSSSAVTDLCHLRSGAGSQRTAASIYVIALAVYTRP